jgi:hypothetical protein
LAVENDTRDMLGGEIRKVRDPMSVRVEVTKAGVRRVRESSSIGGCDDGRAMRSECTRRVCTCTLRVCACTLRVCTCLRRRKFVDPVERISKHPSVVSTRPSVVGKRSSVIDTCKRGGCVVVPCEAILL